MGAGKTLVRNGLQIYVFFPVTANFILFFSYFCLQNKL